MNPTPMRIHLVRMVRFQRCKNTHQITSFSTITREMYQLFLAELLYLSILQKNLMQQDFEATIGKKVSMHKAA